MDVPAPEIQDLSALCGEAVDAVGSIPRYQVSIGVSLHHTDPLTLADAAEEAEQARQFERDLPPTGWLAQNGVSGGSAPSESALWPFRWRR